MQVQHVYITFMCKTLLCYGYSFLPIQYFATSSLIANVQKHIFQAVRNKNKLEKGKKKRSKKEKGSICQFVWKSMCENPID